MELGPFYYSNQKRFSTVQDKDWKAALSKCREHVKWKLKQKTLYGAHTGANLGADPIEYYINLSYDKLLVGEWDWKKEFSLSEQMIRIINSHISKEVDKSKTKKADSFKIRYTDIEEEFYNLGESQENDSLVINEEFEKRIKVIEESIKGDLELEIMWDALKEGKKRNAIAEILEISPKQFDKVKERLFRRVKNNQDKTK